MADEEDLEATTPPDLYPCSICSRTFKAESLDKHYKSCEKNASKKRKIFDSTKQRIQGTDLAEYLPSLLKTKKAETVSPRKKPPSNWKAQHLEFVKAIRAARGVAEGYDGDTTSMDAITRPPNTEPCPTCDRNFGPKAYERHIEWCREQKARLPSKSPASNETNIAKERLAARTKYRAPLTKTKRSIVREKYAGIGDKPPLSGEKTSSSCHADLSRKSSVKAITSPDRKPASLPNIKLLHGRNQVPARATAVPKVSASAMEFQRTSIRSSNRQCSPTKRNVSQSMSSPKSVDRSSNVASRSRGLSPQKAKREVKEAPARKELFHVLSPKAARGDAIRADKRIDTCNVPADRSKVKVLNRTQSKRIDNKSKLRILMNVSLKSKEDKNESALDADITQEEPTRQAGPSRSEPSSNKETRTSVRHQHRCIIEKKIFKAKNKLIYSPTEQEDFLQTTSKSNVVGPYQTPFSPSSEMSTTVSTLAHTKILQKKRNRPLKYLPPRGLLLKNPLNRLVMSTKKVNVGEEMLEESSSRPFNESMRPCKIPLRRLRRKKKVATRFIVRSEPKLEKVDKVRDLSSGSGSEMVNNSECSGVHSGREDKTFYERLKGQRSVRADPLSPGIDRVNKLHGKIKPVWFKRVNDLPEKFIHAQKDNQIKLGSSRSSSYDEPQELLDDISTGGSCFDQRFSEPTTDRSRLSTPRCSYNTDCSCVDMNGNSTESVSEVDKDQLNRPSSTFSERYFVHDEVKEHLSLNLSPVSEEEDKQAYPLRDISTGSETGTVCIGDGSASPTPVCRQNSFVVDKEDHSKCNHDVLSSSELEVTSEDIHRKVVDVLCITKESRKALPQNLVNILSNRMKCAGGESTPSGDSEDEAKFACITGSRSGLKTSLRNHKDLFCFQGGLDVNSIRPTTQEEDASTTTILRRAAGVVCQVEEVKSSCYLPSEEKCFDVDGNGKESDSTSETGKPFLRGVYHTKSIYQKMPLIKLEDSEANKLESCQSQTVVCSNIHGGDNVGQDNERDIDGQDIEEDIGGQDNEEIIGGQDKEEDIGEQDNEICIHGQDDEEDIGGLDIEECDGGLDIEEYIGGQDNEECDGEEERDERDLAKFPNTDKLYPSKSSRLLSIRGKVAKARCVRKANMHGVKSEGNLFREANIESKRYECYRKEYRSVPLGARRVRNVDHCPVDHSQSDAQKGGSRDSPYDSDDERASDSDESCGSELGSSRFKLLSFQEVEDIEDALSNELEGDQAIKSARGTAGFDGINFTYEEISKIKHQRENILSLGRPFHDEIDVHENYENSDGIAKTCSFNQACPNNCDCISMVLTNSLSSKAASRTSFSSGEEYDSDRSCISELESPKKFLRYWGCNLSVSFEENKAGELFSGANEGFSSNGTISHVPCCSTLPDISKVTEEFCEPKFNVALWTTNLEPELETDSVPYEDIHFPSCRAENSLKPNHNNARPGCMQAPVTKKSICYSKSSPCLSPNAYSKEELFGGKRSGCTGRKGTRSVPRLSCDDGSTPGNLSAKEAVGELEAVSICCSGRRDSRNFPDSLSSAGSRRRVDDLKRGKTMRRSSRLCHEELLRLSRKAGCGDLKDSSDSDRSEGGLCQQEARTSVQWQGEHSALSTGRSANKDNDSATKNCKEQCTTKSLQSDGSNDINITRGSPKQRETSSAAKISITDEIDHSQYRNTEPSSLWESIPGGQTELEECEMESLLDDTSLHATDLDEPDEKDCLMYRPSSPNNDTQDCSPSCSSSLDSLTNFSSPEYSESKRSILDETDIVLDSYELSKDIPLSEETSPTMSDVGDITTRSRDSRRSPKHRAGIKAISKKDYMASLRASRNLNDLKQRGNEERRNVRTIDVVSEVIVPLSECGSLKKTNLRGVTATLRGERKLGQLKPNVLVQRCTERESAAGRRKPIVEVSFWEQQAKNTENMNKKVSKNFISCIPRPQKTRRDESFWAEHAKSGSKTLLSTALAEPISPLKREVPKPSAKLPPLRELSKKHCSRNRLPGMNGSFFSPSLPNFTLLLNSSDAPPTDTYDPFASAKLQLMELLAQGEASPKSVSSSSSVASSPLVPRVLEASPTSAFSRYTSPPPPQESDLFVPLNRPSISSNDEDFDDLIISGHSVMNRPTSKSSSISESNENLNNIMDIAASLSSLSICSLEDLHLHNGGVGARSSRRNSKYRDKLENAARSLRRSVSMFHPTEELDDLGPSVFEDLLRVSENEDDDFPAAIYPNTSFSLSSLGIKPSSLQAPDAYGFTEYSEDGTDYKRTNDQEQFDMLEKEAEFSSPENISNSHRSSGNKFNADSAYSSLNRKSPLLATRLEPNQSQVVDSTTTSHFELLRMSSSGSDSSLPPIQVSYNVEEDCNPGSDSSLPPIQASRKELTSPALKQMSPPRVHSSLQSAVQKMSKFCHQCGSKFPLTEAKFCCECGVRRLIV